MKAPPKRIEASGRQGMMLTSFYALKSSDVQIDGKQKLVFEAPSRGLVGFRTLFATLTRGSGLMHRAFRRYGPYK